MLVLTRNAGESLVIGDSIEIRIIEIQGDKVKIGIDAPKDVMILRSELIDEARSANFDAASSDIDLGSIENAIKNDPSN